MKSDETPSYYLERAQEYADALANIGEPVKDKDLVMLVIAGLRDEYHDLKGNIVARQSPPAFCELHALLADHDFLVKKSEPVLPTQAFSAVTNPTSPAPGLLGPTPNSVVPNPTIQALQQLVNQLSLQPNQNSPIPSPSQAYYTHRPGFNRGQNNGRGQNNRCGRGSYNNYNQNRNSSSSRNPFPWASTQTMVYGTCN
ncbi:hypothetical protein CTI12_AA220080 [Artemisia annua]|uniref:Uncharacterized protein n=1 Tax=Artemisia annua TaxID=35608 RepID=A0A2U1NRG5_ARTAN|nr:hypothetical protein CTI12_AA220080 [Artemisia annua]